MTQQVQCSCGSRFAAQPQLAGQTVPCPACGSAICIPAPQPAPVGLTPVALASPITVACSCGQRFAAEPRLAGQQVPCPNCRQPLLVPNAAQPTFGAAGDFGGLDSGNFHAAPTTTPANQHIDGGGGLTMPIKIAIGLGGGVVGVLFVAMIASSFLSSRANNSVASQEAVPGNGSTAATPAEPAAPSTLASAVDFVSGLVSGKPKVYATPQAVFDAYWRAREKEDLQTLLGTLAPHRREEVVMSSIRLLATLRREDPDLTDGLEKYGVDFEEISRATSQTKMREIVAGIKNPAGFIEAVNRRLAEAGRQRWKELAEAAKKARSNTQQPRTTPRPNPTPRRQLTAEEREQAAEMRRQMEALPRLEDLEIVGNAAKGTVVKGGDLFHVSSEMAFVKIGESWFVDQVQM